MADLTKEEVVALGHAVVLEIRDSELTEVTYSLNALLEALDAINPPGLENIEALNTEWYAVNSNVTLARPLGFLLVLDDPRAGMRLRYPFFARKISLAMSIEALVKGRPP